MASPSERYAAALQRAARRKGAEAGLNEPTEDSGDEVRRFATNLSFPMDGFQVRACTALAEGRSVLVAAPTGAGKTVVGEFAVHLARRAGQKCFYTTPIKALSNQKYHDLVDAYGSEQVGLLTGDTSINSEAPIVVMTTEVLRNMLYAGSSTIHDLGYVVMDEVHYLADRFRGGVWEEVIIHLPAPVTIVALSATVSNAEEFGAWLGTVRGSTDVIVEEHRPVPLYQHVMVGNQLHDLFSGPGVVNPELVRTSVAEARLNRHRMSTRDRGRRRRSPSTPWRSEVIRRLDDSGLLPAIFFIFSRAACDDAVQQCLAAGLRLTTPQERQEIREEVLAASRQLPDEDLAALGFDAWLDGLERGLAAHHAGLLPVFKETVELLFRAGLIKVVFATETLALGINMPARTVVLEKLVKWNGETHVELTPGEYTQLTGRAGRRGIDVEGHGVVVWHTGLDPAVLAGLASTRTYPLRSSFQPSYNMAVNLAGTLGQQAAREVLETSFAQFQADRSVVGLASTVRRLEEAQSGYLESMQCHLGDFAEYSALRAEISRQEKESSRDASARRRATAMESLVGLRVGDMILIPAGRRAGCAVVLDPGSAQAGDWPRPMVLTAERQVRRLNPVDVPDPISVIGRLRIPKGFNARNPQARRDLAAALLQSSPPSIGRAKRAQQSADDRTTQLRAKLRQHPCHGCADRETHARWGERYTRTRREIADLQQRIAGRTSSVARRYDAICDILVELGYLLPEPVAATSRVTHAGSILRRLYTESDLLVSQCLREGTWRELNPAELAAVVSTVVFEGRKVRDARGDAEAPRIPGAVVADVLRETIAVWSMLHEAESRHGLDITRALDAGFAWAAHRWATGATLASVLAGADLSAGDFVRWSRQVIDVLGQVAMALDDDDPLRDTARAAARAMDRGVVAYAVAD